MEKMKRLVDRLADRPPTEIADSPVCLIADYRAKLRKLKEADGWREQPIRLPVSNMVEFETEDGIHIIVRPSGTEPKLKMYLSAHCDEKAGADERLLAAEAVVKEWVKADE
jgi:phosphoglucomutase